MKLQAVLGAGAIALSLLGTTALTMPAFAADVPAGTKLADDQTFNYRVLDNINAVDPDIVEDVDTASVVEDLFEGLYNEDAKGNPVAGAATSYDVNSDFTQYTFHLRDAKWSNGDPVKASDFVYSWERAVDPKTASNYSYFLGLAGVKNADDIVAGKQPITNLGVKAIDDKTLEVDLSKPVPYFVRMTAHATLFPVPQAVVEKFGADWTKPENIVGNGAYTLAENSPGERVSLKRNKNYWDDAHTVIETVNFLTINDENQGLTRYLAGEVDWTDTPAGQFPTLKAQYPDQVYSDPFLCTYYFDFNVTPSGNPALQDVRVRQAISYAIDRDVIVNNVLQGGQTAAYYFTPPATAGFQPPDLDYAKMSQADRDAKAKQLLADAGYGPDKPLSFTYIYNTSVAHQQIATVVAQMLKEKLGINMTIQDMEFATLLDKRHSRDFEVARDAWCGDYNEASTFEGLMASDSSQNNSGYANKDVDQWLKDASTSKDPNIQYKQIEEQVAKDVPIIPIYFYSHPFLLKTNVKGWPFANVEQTWYAKDLFKVAQ
ncbi:MAG TPA: peptide ABC transporter substrate-binding protein [Devosia sp.]|jgi:oligopeptide transport system substrate-binding protein|nr:peptide ABC transporter substrate-binding protein [Devosia sp.]